MPACAAAVSSTVSAEVCVQCSSPEARSRLEFFSFPPGFFFSPRVIYEMVVPVHKQRGAGSWCRLLRWGTTVWGITAAAGWERWRWHGEFSVSLALMHAVDFLVFFLLGKPFSKKQKLRQKRSQENGLTALEDIICQILFRVRPPQVSGKEIPFRYKNRASSVICNAMSVFQEGNLRKIISFLVNTRVEFK